MDTKGEKSEIAQSLAIVADYLKDNEAVIQVAQTVGKYEGEIAVGIARRLADAAVEFRDKEAVIRVAQTVGRYEGEIADKIMKELDYAAYSLRDREAVIQVAQTVGKYEGEIAVGIARGLANVAYCLKDEEAVIRVAQTVGKYEGEIAVGIARGLADATSVLKDKDAVIRVAHILSEDGIVDVVGRYEGEIAEWIAMRLANVAGYLRDKEAVIRVAQAVGRYEGEIAEEIARRLAYAADYLRDKDAVSVVAQTVSRYEGEIAERIARTLTNTAYYLRDKDAVIQVAQAVGRYEGEMAVVIAQSLTIVADYFKDKEVIQVAQAVGRYEGEMAVVIASEFATVAGYFKDKDAVRLTAQVLSEDEIVETIGRYEGEIAEEIVQGLADAAYYLRDKDVVIRVAQTVGRYREYAALDVVRNLTAAAEQFKDSKKMERYLNMLNTVNGFGMVDVIIGGFSGANIVNDDLDTLITDRNSLRTCLTYVSSGNKLPKPTAENIGDYKRIANDYAKSTYGIKTDLSLEQISLLASLGESMTREVTELIDGALPVREFTYTIKDGGAGNVYFEVAGAKTPEERAIAAVTAVIGSRDAEKKKAAQEYMEGIVGKHAVNAAFTEFSQRHKPLKRGIIDAIGNGDYKGAIAILRSSGSKAISRLMDAAENERSAGPAAAGSRTVTAWESKNPLDYDSRILLACTCINGEYRESGMMNYCRDNNVVLVAYSFGSQACAMAICYLEGNILLVDSVEGRERIRNDAFFGVVRHDLEERARMLGADTVIFNKDVVNPTPKEFLEFLKRNGEKPGEVDMRLDTNAYLEAFDSNPVKGFIVKVNAGRSVLKH